MQSTMLDAETQRSVIPIFKRSGEKKNHGMYNHPKRRGSSLQVGGHVGVMEKLGYYLNLKEMNNPPRTEER